MPGFGVVVRRADVERISAERDLLRELVVDLLADRLEHRKPDPVPDADQPD